MQQNCMKVSFKWIFVNSAFWKRNSLFWQIHHSYHDILLINTELLSLPHQLLSKWKHRKFEVLGLLPLSFPVSMHALMKSLLHKPVRSCSQAINDHSQDDTSSSLVSFSLFFFFFCLPPRRQVLKTMLMGLCCFWIGHGSCLASSKHRSPWFLCAGTWLLPCQTNLSVNEHCNKDAWVWKAVLVVVGGCERRMGSGVIMAQRSQD